MMPVVEARLAIVLGIVGLLAWPWSYAWMLWPGRVPPLVSVLIPVAEWGAVACAIAAIVLGRRARAARIDAPGARWGPRLGGLTVGLMVAAWVLAIALYR